VGTRTRNRTRGAVAALGVAALVLAGACSSTTEDQVVSAGPGTTGNPQSPAVDNPTTSALTAPPTSPASTTTTDPDVAATTATTQPSTTATSVGPATSVPGESVVDGSLTMQLFWVRPPDDPRPLDLPGYRDPESGPRPLVVYGSATNDTGAAVPG